MQLTRAQSQAIVVHMISVQRHPCDHLLHVSSTYPHYGCATRCGCAALHQGCRRPNRGLCGQALRDLRAAARLRRYALRYRISPWRPLSAIATALRVLAVSMPTNASLSRLMSRSLCLEDRPRPSGQPPPIRHGGGELPQLTQRTCGFTLKWDDALIERSQAARRAELPANMQPVREEWRDRRLMAWRIRRGSRHKANWCGPG
jgi:hypothetical protein